MAVKQKIRVLHVTPFYPPDKGGIANHVSALCDRFPKFNVDLSVVSTKNIRDSDNYLPNSARLTRIPSIFLPGWPYPTLRSVSIPIDIGFRINSLIKHGNFDVIHVHGLHYPLSWMAIYSARRHHVPSVLTVHGIYGLNPNAQGGKSKSEDFMYRFWFSRIISNTSIVIGLTPNITNFAQKYGSGSTAYCTIPNGVNTSMYRNQFNRKLEYRSKYGLDYESVVLLFVGRLESVKGILELAISLKKILTDSNKAIELVIVGSGSLETQVRSILQSNRKVKFVNWLQYDLIHEIYLASDIFVIPSKFEGLPLTIVEAMNAGLHIAYSAVGGIPEILKGYSMKTELPGVSPTDIEIVLNRLLNSFPLRRDTDSMRYAQKFDWDSIVNQTLKVYQKILLKK